MVSFAALWALVAATDATPSLANANSSNAKSQYDIACVHYTAAHS